MTSTTDKTTGEITEIVDLAAFLAGHLNGRTAEELSAEFHQLLDAVKSHGKKGEMRITLVVEPPANGVDSAPLPIGVESAVKAPKPTPVKSLYFLDDDGNPVREDPRQMSIEFRPAPSNTTFKDA
ncbi:hypothetical protein OG746_26895 [Streptomyces sp. NBC_01016]|uniref:hypothetical protein n=1 Tax=Streptomyces sp. NBC_01016 TaxID=2903720 RepID=UPI00225A3409|nr:hypothetical protein [Streptomyces sp. NBC_01016]MCX4827141.1 hypothetical protein [Streptomyces sp. NBC_01016]MCX4832370.1 hypothetical protein [Streptomyces sp. NBC_01016]